MDFNQFYKLRVQYRQLSEEIALFSDSEKLQEFLDGLRANPNPPFPYSEEAITVFLKTWEFQHKKGGRVYKNTRIIPPNVMPKDEEVGKPIVLYTTEMCEVLATSILAMIKLYDHDETREVLLPIVHEVQKIVRNAILSRSVLENKPQFNSREEFKRLRNFQTRAVAIIGHQRQIDFE